MFSWYNGSLKHEHLKQKSWVFDTLRMKSRLNLAAQISKNDNGSNSIINCLSLCFSEVYIFFMRTGDRIILDLHEAVFDGMLEFGYN